MNVEGDKPDHESKELLPPPPAVRSLSQQYLAPSVPPQLGTFGSVLDVSASCQDISFRLQDTTFSAVWPQILACISVASFHLGLGAVLGFSAILIPQLEAPDSDIQVTKEDISWIASVVPLTIPVGALVTGYMVDRIGRTRTILVGIFPYVIGWVCIALAKDLNTLMIGRVLTGFSTAMASCPAVVYITEIARPDLRGALLCMVPSLVSMGMVVIYAKGAFLHWRTISWISTTYCLVPILMMALWSPESPVWLVAKGRSQDALKALTYLLRKEKKPGVADQLLSELTKEYQSKQGLSNPNSSSMARFFRNLMKPNCFKPLLLLTLIFAFQQFSGIYITIFYAVSFFKDVGESIDPYISSIGIGIVRLFVGLVTSFLLKSFGRRPLYLLSGTGMAFFIFVSGYITKEVKEGNMEPSLIPVLCILLYMSLGVIGLLSIPWTMTAELFPLEVRGMAQGLIISLAHILMFIALKLYPFLVDWLGGMYAVQWMFSAVSLTAVAFIFVFLPETHNKELIEIEQYFKSNTVYLLSKEKKPKLKKNKEVRNEIVIRITPASNS